MRSIFKYITTPLVLAALFASCTKDDGALNSAAECTWHTSSDQSTTTIISSPDKYISFMDLSIGYLSHKWEVTGEGIYFLEGEMEWGQTDYSNLINYDAPSTTDQTTIHVLFTEPGQHTVRLYNTYNKQVSYPYAEWNTANGEFDYFTMEGLYENGVYVMDIPITVDVYNNTLEPSAEVYYDAECKEPVTMGVISGTTYETVQVEYGDTLYFLDTSYDRPNTWDWSCERLGEAVSYTGIANAGRVVPITFDKLTLSAAAGIDDEPFVVSLAVQRDDPSTLSSDKNVPTASRVVADIPLSVVVVPSTKPVEYSIKQVDQSNIQLALLNSEFAADATFDHTKLNVTWTNAGAAVTAGSCTVVSATLNADDQKVIDITLTDGDLIYNTDEIKLYTTAGTEFDAVLFDGKSLSIAEPTAPNVTTTYHDYFISEDFETSSALSWSVLTATGLSGVINYSVADNPDQSGINASAKVLYADGRTATSGDDALLGTQYTIMSPEFTTDAPASNLYLTLDYYIPSTTDATIINTGFGGVFNTADSGVYKGNVSQWMKAIGDPVTYGWLGISGKSKDVWQTITIGYEADLNIDKVFTNMRFMFNSNGYYGEFYIDNISFGSVEIRE